MKGKKITIKKLISMLIIFIFIIGLNTLAYADDVIETEVAVPKVFNTGDMMPERNISGPSGMLPQYYRAGMTRKVTLPSSRNDVNATSWDATMDGEVVYCAAYGKYVRYGWYDGERHYIYPDTGVTLQGTTAYSSGESIINQINSVKSAVNEYYEKYLASRNYYLDRDGNGRAPSIASLHISEEKNFNEIDEKAIGHLIIPNRESTRNAIKYHDEQEAADAAQNFSVSLLSDIFEKMGRHLTPQDYEKSIDGGIPPGAITATEGPEVVVLEQTDRATDHYKESGGGSYGNDKQGYIFTACENVYGNGEYAKKYSLNDIQGAFWRSLGVAAGSARITEGGEELFQKSLEYESFLNEVQGGYNATLDDSLAQVIVDRNNKNYIVGPFTVEYPYYEDISYVKSLVINNNLIYDEKHEDFELVMEGSTKSASGMEKDYPASGQKFFVKVPAETLGMDTKTLGLKVNFEYINNTNATVETTLTANADVFKYYGHCLLNGEYALLDGSYVIDISYKIGKWEEGHKSWCNWHNTYYTINPATNQTMEEHEECNCGNIVYYNEEIHARIVCGVKQPYIQMDEDPIKRAQAQTLKVISDAERNYKIEPRECEIDLTMELGGTVWEDVKTGKESNFDGLFKKSENEKGMPNVEVALYREDGTFIGKTKTDGEGKYIYKDLPSMYQYYIEFTYNGQFYQPVQAVTGTDSKNGWGKGTWQLNSNAKEKIKDREEYNLIFFKIEASPENYEGKLGKNTTYTKEELMEAGIIDEYGNLIGNSNASMVQYVKDCMIKAYSMKTEDSFDLYPTPPVFLIGSEYKWHGTPGFVMSRIGLTGIKLLYDDAYYINLGLEHREESDLALKKDIEKVTLEINNQVHNYEYNSLDTYKCKDCDHEGKNTELVYNELDGLDHCPNCGSTNIEQKWDIGVRLSDEFKYYDTDYSREIYKSDYIYKVDFYGPNPGEFGKEQSEELDVYITYKIALRNQSLTIRTRVDEVVDYFDSDLTYIPERSYIAHYTRDKDNKRVTDKYSVQPLEEEANKVFESIYNSKGKIEGYNNLYIRGLGKNAQILENNSKYTEEELEYIKQNGVFMDAGDTAYAYITFRVNKDSQRNVLLDENNWVLDENGNISSTNSIGVGKENIAEINGYSTIYADGTTVPYIGEDKDGNPITRDVSGKPAGLVDRDSTPGNVDEIEGIRKDLDFETEEGKKIYEQFEDDSDKAPNMKLVLYKEDNTTRVITGNVWEDLRTEKVDKATVGNGIQDDNETLINGVTVQLVELMDNGTEFIWREFENGTGTADTTSPIINAYINGDTNRPLVVDYKFDESHDGQYAFKSFMPGKYVVRFIYGDTVKTVVPNSLGGMNAKSYNGQDYKSTTYQKDIPQQKEYEWREASTWQDGKEIKGNLLSKIFTYKEDASNNETAKLLKDQSGRIWQNDNNNNNLYAYLYDITSSEPITNVSDAKDIESRRNEVISYSDVNVTNYIAEVLASHKADYEPMNDRNQLLNDLIMNTQMIAETGVMVIELEYDRTVTTEQIKDNPSSYLIQNVNLGLEERPKAQLVLDKKVTNVKLTLADGSILFDAKKSATNVLWKDHKPYEITYENNMFKEIRNNSTDKLGLVQLSMDEEIMHGSTIEISYEITVQNYGEVDYYNTYNNLKSVDRQFYYNGKPSSTAKVVTTNANEVIDYVGNNLQFNVADNSDWSVITQKDIEEQGLVNKDLAEYLERYNTIISTKNLSKELLPKQVNEENSKISVPLVLTQLITAENDSDDLTYKNITEIVKTSNTNGRRMEYSVVGNQNPTKNPQELDTDEAQIVRILPPFGSNNLEPIIITIIAITALGILVVGIIFIKQKVLTK